MPASRSVVSVLVRALGAFSRHPQGRPCGRPPAAAVLAPAATRREPGLPAPRWAGWNQTGHRVESRRESTSAALAGYVEDAFRERLDYDRAVLNQGEDFPPVTDHLHPGRRIGG